MSPTVIYTKPNCSFCVKAKALLNANHYGYKEIEIGKDITREEFLSIYPDAKTVPQIVVEGNYVGGYTDLVEHFNTKGRQQLNG